MSARTQGTSSVSLMTLPSVAAGIDLLERMLPLEPIVMPAVGVEEAERVCGVPIHA